MRSSFWLCLLFVVMACGHKAPPPQQVNEPSPSPSKAAVHDTNTTTAKSFSTPTPLCPESPSPEFFLCHREQICAAVDKNAPIGLYSFLCLLSTPREASATQTMAEITTLLPYSFRKNLTFKHGMHHTPLRGHAIEEKELTTTANLEQPRVLMWDEASGFTISFNGGPIADSDDDPRSAQELHMMAYDDQRAEFAFWTVDVPLKAQQGVWQVAPSQPSDPLVDCRRCHGQRSRPIWSMYPDWPGFFGSDTDELTQRTKSQEFEKQALARFRECIVPGTSTAPACQDGKVQGDSYHRYTPLFDDATQAGLTRHFDTIDTDAVRAYLVEKAKGDPRRKAQFRLTTQAQAVAEGDDTDMQRWLGLSLHPSYPYRPNHRLQKSEASRALFHRPNLRVGILYNRLNSRRVMALFRKSPAYAPFRKLILFSLMDCAWDVKERDAWQALLSRFEEATHSALAKHDMQLPDPDSDGRILYPVLLAALGLQLRDIDIRFSYPNKHFDEFDSSYHEASFAQTPMDLGYIKYKRRDNNQQNEAVRYFNSYFDGSSSLDELLAAQILQEIGTTYSHLYELNSFATKFGQVRTRYELDKALFAKMDTLSKWLPLPYPKHLKPLHNRQAFMRKRAGRYPFRDQHTAVCGQLQSDLRNE